MEPEKVKVIIEQREPVEISRPKIIIEEREPVVITVNVVASESLSDLCKSPLSDAQNIGMGNALKDLIESQEEKYEIKGHEACKNMWEPGA